MFQANLDQQQKEVLFELLKLLAEVDGKITFNEMELIKKWKKIYGHTKYQYQEYSEERIKSFFMDFSEEDKVSILTHGILLAMVDDDFSRNQKSIIKSFFDMLSPESVEHIQELIDSYGAYDFNVKEFVFNDKDDNVIKHEAIKLMNKFSRKRKAKDIDEKKLFNMNKGPVKKVWGQVLNLWNVLSDPKVDLSVKAIAVGALAYLILPVDVIPDFIPFAGLTDDVGVIMYAISQIAKYNKKSNLK
jgi:uncharacterized membrane protein YkvA (DUF1232 family)